jgi:DNA-binding beta-propeller fold protein YncE
VAILTAPELAAIRQQYVATLAAINITKTPINAALQAIEDTLTDYVLVASDAGKTVQQLVSQAIDAATAPFSVTFTALQKKLLFAYWAQHKYLKDKA